MESATLTGLSILLLEDEVMLRRQLAAAFERLGADVTATGTLAAAKKFLADLNFDFALIDVNLPDGLGSELLKEKLFSKNTGVIVMTAHGGIGGAVEAMRMGAIDYLTKPFDPAELPLVIRRARQRQQTVRVEEFRAKQEPEFYFGEMLSPLENQLKKILAADERMKTFLPPVLIQGETGTGKTTIARWLHQHGPRAGAPLIEVNCSALPETLAESELFGHERGAFTDARTARMGLFEAANGGTLFLDELPSLSPALQAKVLTVIEDHRIRRIGGNRELEVDARIIAATNRDLKEQVVKGQFREDLYHRLDLYRIQLPPLRSRGAEIVALADLIVTRLASRHRLPKREFTALGKQRLLSYQWPGNVRELAHELERAIVFEESNDLNLDHLFSANAPLPGPGDESDWFNRNFVFPKDGFQLEEAINRMIQHALKQTNGNVSAAARLLGVSRDYLRYRLEDRTGKPGE